MDADTRVFVSACAVCAKSLALPACQPAMIPACSQPPLVLYRLGHRCLPPSQGNTTILTIIDCFSKAIRFVALPKHAIPQDIVSDHRPQFISQAWKSFCNAFCVTLSLSSGFNPHTNGQAEWANQELEVALQCVTVNNTST